MSVVAAAFVGTGPEPYNDMLGNRLCMVALTTGTPPSFGS